MVLESVLQSRFALHHPLAMVLYGIIITSVSIAVSLATFAEYASILTIALITIGTVPLLYRVLSHEERVEAQKPKNPLTFFGRHFHLIKIYAFLFIGFILAFSFWYVSLHGTGQENAFREQEKTWQQISGLRGNATGTTQNILNNCGSSEFWPLALDCIFANNAIVLGWSLVLSFFFGAGAIFLVAWNASVIGVVLGHEFLSNSFLPALGTAVGLLPHGLPEIMAYFIGAIAGGIISVAVARKKHLTDEWKTISKDVFVMVVAAVVLLFFAALLEAALLLNP
ncbi:MAG: stage II sporulation protein M [Candidatus Micrarchaeota archaeon]